MKSWNFASTWEIVAEQLPDADALIHENRRLSWSAFDSRAGALANFLLRQHIGHQDKVAQYLYNCPEYLESMFACFKAGLVPVNTNYRYRDDELVYLWENGDVVAVVFEGDFSERIEAIRHRVPRVRTWICVYEVPADCPSWSFSYEEAVADGIAKTTTLRMRGADDLLLVYAGGTTGMPKGVMWRQDSLIRALSGTNPILASDPDKTALAQLRGCLSSPGPRMLPGCPLMHGTGQFTALMTLCGGGTVVTTGDRNFDAEDLLDCVQLERVNMLVIVGDTFARPILAALDASPDRWDLSSLTVMTSSGVMWSQDTKQALLTHNSGMLLVDAFSSSEALGLGQSVSSAGGSSQTARFTLGGNARVIDDFGDDIVPGSGQIGRVAVLGHTPIGYYKNPEKSARTFLRLNGETYSVPGDFATVEADGSLTLLGRGSLCINTGGEKVFPEEVEEALKEHRAVCDAVVVGLPDNQFGQSVTGIVQLYQNSEASAQDLIAHVRERLASYKAPRNIVFGTVARAANGKADYAEMTRFASDELAVSAASEAAST